MPKTLLLADDSVVIQKLVGLSFANEDVELITTDNGDDALTKAREVRPDLVLADVVMPGRNGYEVCEAIKTDAGLRHIPVLLLTGTFEAFDEERARTVGSDGHITKPFEAQGLVDRVTDLLSRVPAAPAAPAPAPAREHRYAMGTDSSLELPVSETPAASDDDAYDFFDDDASQDLVPPPPAAAAPPVSAPASPDDVFEFGTDLDPLASTDPFSTTDPETLDTNFDLDSGGGDMTMAVTPEPRPVPTPEAPAAPPPVPNDMHAPDATQIALGETMLQDDFSAPPRAGVASLDQSLAQPARAPVEAQKAPPAIPADDSAQTMLADDLFASAAPAPPPVPDVSETTEPGMPPPMDSGFEFGFDEPSAPVRTATREAPARVVVADLEMESALDASDPLEGISPEPAEMHDFGAAAPIEAWAPSPADAAESTHSGYDVSSSDLGDPFAASGEDLAPPAPAAPSRGRADMGVSAPELAASPTTATGPDVSPVMRDRIHETLEKIAWEAFADISDSIVRQVLERVESIVWDVVPHMAEALIQEEIRRMKGEND